MKVNFSKTRLSLFSTAAAMGALSVSMMASLPAISAQDIEIIGSNGKQVEMVPNVPSEAAPAMSAPNAEPQPANRPGLGFGNGAGDAFGAAFGGALGGAGRGISVIGPDGEPMLLSTEGARSVVINRSFNMVNENGVQRAKAGGKAIVVDADGQRREYELAESDNVEGLPVMDDSQKPAATKSYMIGVICQPVPEMLRSQLGIDSETGLVVQDVSPNSPAETAGLKKFDVLLFADDQQLSSLKDLSTVVQEIGAQESSLVLTVVRAGDEIPIEITPTERDFATAQMQRMPMDMFEMNDMGPGILFGGDGQGMNRMREMMRQQMQQMKQELQNMDGLIQEGLPVELPIPMNIR